MITEIEEKLMDQHFLSYQDYVEIELLQSRPEESSCYRCGERREPLCYIDPEQYSLPCWNCLSTRKSDRLEAVRSVGRNIKDYYDRLLGDRYLQLFIVDPIYFSATLPHCYSEFKLILGNLDLPGRSDIWFLDWSPGFPKIINYNNLAGIKIVNLSSQYEITSTSDVLKVNDYIVDLPEMVPYDVRHHSRYSLLNKGSDRKTKRLRISGTPDCVKFYNTSNDEVKKIFRIHNQAGEDIDFTKLSKADQVILKLALMRNKTYMRKIFDIIFELIPAIGTFRDAVFLRNTITTDPIADTSLSFSWAEREDLGDVNISII